MSGVVAKMFIQSFTESPAGGGSYQLGVVCRGDENKEWSAATPTGTMKHGPADYLDLAWRERRDNGGAGELEVVQVPDPDGGWIMDKCDFTYGGCAVHFRQKDSPWGELSLTINATAATKVLREAYAQSLLDGNPAKFTMYFQNPR